MTIIILDIPKMSFNKYNHLHWTQKKKFKDNLRLMLLATKCPKLTGGYDLHFTFTFIGRRLDTINVSHYCKIIEDYIFKQDKDNRTICISVEKGTENKCELNLKKHDN